MPGNLLFYTTADGASTTTERVRITSDGQVLIGTATESSADVKLAVSDSGTTIFKVNNTDNGTAQITLANTGSSNGQIKQTAGDMYFSIAGNEKLIVKQNGVVDVKEGQISLTKQGASNFLKVGSGQNANNYAYIDFIGDTTYTNYGLRLLRGTSGANTLSQLVHRGTGEFTIKTNEAAPIILETSDTERLRIESTGQAIFKGDSSITEAIRIAPGVDASSQQEFGIGFASNANHTHPAAKITLKEYDASDSRGHLIFYTRSSNTDSAPTATMRISHDGTVNVPGSVDGNGLLHIGQNTSSYVRVEDLASETYGIVIRKAVSSTYAALRLVNTNGHRGNLNVSNSGVALANASDYRLKENETTISDGITRVKQLIPRRFNFKTDSTTVDGFFAHEVSPVVPESVFGEKDATINEEGDGYQMLDQSKLIPVLTAALQEAIAKIETLENKVSALEG